MYSIRNGLTSFCEGLGRIIIKHLQSNPHSKLKVASIGINYDRPKEFRSKVLLGSEDNIHIDKKWLEEYSHPHKAIVALNQEIYQNLQAHTIEVEPEDEFEFHTLSNMDSSFKLNSLSRKILIAKTIKRMQERHPLQASRLKEDSKKAQEILDRYKLNFRKLKAHEGFDYAKFMIWLILSPVALGSLLLNIIPIGLGKWITDKTVRIVLNTILWLIFQISIMIVLIQFHWIGWLYIPVVFALLNFYLWYREITHFLRSTRRLMRLRKNTDDYRQLQDLVKEMYRIRASFGLGPQ